MKKQENNVTLYGIRVKQEMNSLIGSGENNRFTNCDLAKLWDYSSEKSVSKFLTGTPVSRDRALKFANLCGVRLQYLTGEDDYRTEEERLNTFGLKAKKEYTVTIEYLSSIGLELCVCPYWHTDTDKCAQELPLMSEYLLESETQYIETSIKKHNALIESAKLVQESHPNDVIEIPTDELYFELSKRPPIDRLIEAKVYSDSGLFKNSEPYFVGGFNYTYTELNIKIELRYKVTYKGLYIGTCDIPRISSLLQAINNSTSALIKPLLNWQCLMNEDCHADTAEYEKL